MPVDPNVKRDRELHEIAKAMKDLADSFKVSNKILVELVKNMKKEDA